MNPLHPVTPVEICGRPFTLRYEYRDFAKAEGRLRMALVGPKSAAFWDADTDAYRYTVLLFIGLMNCEAAVLRMIYPQKTPSTLTLDDAAGLFDFESAGYLQTVITDAMEQSAPKAPENREAAATADPLAESTETATPGTPSAPSPESTSA